MMRANSGPAWDKHGLYTEQTRSNTGSNTELAQSVSDVPTGRCGSNHEANAMQRQQQPIVTPIYLDLPILFRRVFNFTYQL